MKTKLALTVCAMALMATTASAQDRTYRIGAAVYGLENEYARNWTAALEEHPAITSGLVELTIFDGRYDHFTQNGQFDTMITQQFDGAIYIPYDSAAGVGIIEKADNADLPVVVSNNPVPSDRVLSYIGSDDTEAGRGVAEAVIEAMGGSGDVVMLEGPAGSFGTIQRGEGIREVVDQHPDVNIIDSRTANWSRSEALAIMQNWITAYPDGIDGVMAQNDEMGLGAIAAIRAAGLDVASFPVAGVDGVTDAVTAVENGDMILSIGQDAEAQAQGALDILLRDLIGEQYEPQSEIWAKYADEMPWNGGTDANYSVPWNYITRDN